MEFLMENGTLIIVALVVGVYIGVSCYSFFSRPRSEQIDDVREWLLGIVQLLDREFESGEGSLKLRAAYDMFLVRFPWLARFVSFRMFSNLVDEALERVETMLTKREAVDE